MKLFAHPYKLQRRDGSGFREGMLIAADFDGIGRGYADLHPWPEYGDKVPVSHDRFLFQRTLELARRDAQARAQNVPLLLDLNIACNALLPSPGSKEELRAYTARGFKTMKLKCGLHVDEEISFLAGAVGETDVRWRLDFNAKLSAKEFFKFMDRVNPAYDKYIEYVEDPTPYDAEVWNRIRARWKVALDFEIARSPWAEAERGAIPTQTVAADVLVYKPARQKFAFDNLFTKAPELRVTVTSMMDHVVGVRHASLEARALKWKFPERVLDCGLNTTDLYEPYEFKMPMTSNQLMPIPGAGIGDGETLAALAWEAL